jgi:hypothetical protein
MSNDENTLNTPFNKTKFHNMADRAVNALWKNHLANITRPENQLKYKDILNLKNAIKRSKSRSGNNFNLHFNVGNRLRMAYNGNANAGPPLYVSFNVYKYHPNGTRVRYNTAARNNGRPINLSRLNVGFAGRSGSPRALAALKIQRAWRNKKAAGPFKNPIVQASLPQIMARLGKRNKQALAGAFRAPSQLNKNLAKRSAAVQPYWRALLNEITRQSVGKGSRKLMTGLEWKQSLRVAGTQLRQPIPENRRANVQRMVTAMRKR